MYSTLLIIEVALYIDDYGQLQAKLELSKVHTPRALQPL